MLGQLLRASSFERWLCSEALDSLVEEASVTLMELSGGQHQLDRDDRNDLVVIDYEDVGARRPSWVALPVGSEERGRAPRVAASK
jgi:DNA repair protein SbcC/Rad50